MIHFFYLKKELLKDNWKNLTYRLLPPSIKSGDDPVHLAWAMAWLKIAYENGRGGVASHYSLLKGKWLFPFPETTGYIIPTFFDYARFKGEQYFHHAALEMTGWLGDVQLKNGACMQGSYDIRKGKNKPIVFNTGQNILGFLRTYRETGNRDYLEFARKAGNFLVESTGGDGTWDRYLHHDIPHTYNSRTAWALLELHKETGEDDYRRVAIANLDWTVKQQRGNGWFDHANFKPGEFPNTHGIAYTTRGLWESYLLSGEEKYRTAALRTAARLLKIYEDRKVLYTFWDENWQNRGKYFKNMKGRYQCLTGNVQLALVWMKIYKETGDVRYFDAASQVIDFVKARQDLGTRIAGARGAIKGAFPLNGSYSFLKYPNWATKFFADALMLRIEIKEESPDGN